MKMARLQLYCLSAFQAFGCRLGLLRIHDQYARMYVVDDHTIIVETTPDLAARHQAGLPAPQFIQDSNNSAYMPHRCTERLDSIRPMRDIFVRAYQTLLTSDLTMPLPPIGANDEDILLMKEGSRCRTIMRYGVELHHLLGLERGRNVLVNEESARREFERVFQRETGWRWEATEDDDASDEEASPEYRSRPSSQLSSPPPGAPPGRSSSDQSSGPSPDCKEDNVGDETDGTRGGPGPEENLTTFGMTRPSSSTEKKPGVNNKTATWSSMGSSRTSESSHPFRQNGH